MELLKTQLTVEVLQDFSASGRKKPWKEKKQNNEILAFLYEGIDRRKAARLRECATRLDYRMNAEGEKRLEGANFCRVRLCPVCAWRRSLKIAVQVEKVISAALATDKPRFILLTLTIKNCKGERLKETIDHLMESWRRLRQTKEFKQVVKGWYRGLEVTHNVNPSSASFDTYHPHFHVLLAVDPSYFNSRNYISQNGWVALWQRAARLDYNPSVDVRTVKGNTAKAVAEVAKYPTKDGEYIMPEDWQFSQKTILILDKALDHRRFAAFGGTLKEIHKKLNLDDPEGEDLVNIGDDRLFGGELVSYYWYTGYQQYYREIE